MMAFYLHPRGTYDDALYYPAAALAVDLWWVRDYRAAVVRDHRMFYALWMPDGGASVLAFAARGGHPLRLASNVAMWLLPNRGAQRHAPHTLPDAELLACERLVTDEQTLRLVMGYARLRACRPYYYFVNDAGRIIGLADRALAERITAPMDERRN